MGLIQRLEHGDVEGVRVGRFNMGINSTCIVYRIGATLIDTGSPNQWRAVLAFARERGLERVLVSHHHEDHCGNGARIQRETGVPVFAPAAGLRYMAQGFPLRLYQRVVWGTPEPFEAQPLPDEIKLGDGVRLRTLHAPGHSEDMVCFLEPDRGWLFSGDLFVATRPRYLRKDENIHQQIESLRRVLEHGFETVFCTHRGVVSDGRQAMQQKLDYLTSLRDEVRRLHREGKSVRAITRGLLGKEDLTSRMTGHHFSKQNLIEACLAPEE